MSLAWRNRRWFRRKPTDWTALKRGLGYDDAPRPISLNASKRPTGAQPYRMRRLLGVYPLYTRDWVEVQRRLGYGRVLEGEIAEREGGQMNPLRYFVRAIGFSWLAYGHVTGRRIRVLVGRALGGWLTGLFR